MPIKVNKNFFKDKSVIKTNKTLAQLYYEQRRENMKLKKEIKRLKSELKGWEIIRNKEKEKEIK